MVELLVVLRCAGGDSLCGEKEGNEGGDLRVLVYIYVCEIHAYTMSKGGDHIYDISSKGEI